MVNNQNSATGPDANFQIRLYESSGVIEYVYGKMTIGASSATVKASIGFTAGSNDNDFVAIQNLSTFPFINIAASEPATQSLVNTVTVSNINGLYSLIEGQRRLFRFTPPTLSGSAIANLQISEITATTASLQWNDTYNNESGYTVLRSADNVNFSFVKYLPANSNSFIDSNLTLGDTNIGKYLHQQRETMQPAM